MANVTHIGTTSKIHNPQLAVRIQLVPANMGESFTLVTTEVTVGIAFVVIISFLLLGQSSNAPLPYSSTSPSISGHFSDNSIKPVEITTTGRVECLPHKKVMGGLFGGVETQECALGFHANDTDKYYGFSGLFNDIAHKWLLGAGPEEIFKIRGVVEPAGNDFNRYDIAGVISNITFAGRADGTISIYEVYSRHYKELTDILDEIVNRTNGGYSMGIDKGCVNGPSQVTKVPNGASCVLIRLDKDLPELSSNIPHDIEGYKVYVRTEK